MKRLMILVAVVGCAGATDDGPEVDGAEESAEPITCDRDDREGTYLVEYDETDGNCGPVPDGLVRLGETDPVPDPDVMCTATADDRWSRRECRVESSFDCLIDGRVYSYVAVLDSNEDASVLSGPMSITVDDVCTSTYDVTWTRQ